MGNVPAPQVRNGKATLLHKPLPPELCFLREFTTDAVATAVTALLAQPEGRMSLGVGNPRALQKLFGIPALVAEASWPALDRTRRGMVSAMEILAAAMLLSSGSTAQKIDGLFDMFVDQTRRLSATAMNVVVETCLSGLHRVFNVRLRREDLAEACSACWAVVDPRRKKDGFKRAHFAFWAWNTPEVFFFCSFRSAASRSATSERLRKICGSPSEDSLSGMSRSSSSTSLAPWEWEPKLPVLKKQSPSRSSKDDSIRRVYNERSSTLKLSPLHAVQTREPRKPMASGPTTYIMLKHDLLQMDLFAHPREQDDIIHRHVTRMHGRAPGIPDPLTPTAPRVHSVPPMHWYLDGNTLVLTTDDSSMPLRQMLLYLRTHALYVPMQKPKRKKPKRLSSFGQPGALERILSSSRQKAVGDDKQQEVVQAEEARETLRRMLHEAAEEEVSAAQKEVLRLTLLEAAKEEAQLATQEVARIEGEAKQEEARAAVEEAILRVLEQFWTQRAQKEADEKEMEEKEAEEEKQKEAMYVAAQEEARAAVEEAIRIVLVQFWTQRAEKEAEDKLREDKEAAKEEQKKANQVTTPKSQEEDTQVAEDPEVPAANEEEVTTPSDPPAHAVMEGPTDEEHAAALARHRRKSIVSRQEKEVTITAADITKEDMLAVAEFIFENSSLFATEEVDVKKGYVTELLVLCCGLDAALHMLRQLLEAGNVFDNFTDLIEMTRSVMSGGPLLVVKRADRNSVAEFLSASDCLLLTSVDKELVRLSLEGKGEQGIDQALEDLICVGLGVATTLEVLTLMKDSIQDLTLLGLASEMLHVSRYFIPGSHDEDIDKVTDYLPDGDLPVRPGDLEITADDVLRLLHKTLTLRGCLHRLRRLRGSPKVNADWASFEEAVMPVQLPTSGTRRMLRATLDMQLSIIQLSDDDLDALVIVSGSVREAVEGITSLQAAGVFPQEGSADTLDVVKLLGEFLWSGGDSKYRPDSKGVDESVGIKVTSEAMVDDVGSNVVAVRVEVS